MYLTKDQKDDSIENLQKAVASLFQYQLLDLNQKEDDVSGTCDVTYISKSSSKYEKHKRNCRFMDVNFHERLEKPLGVSLKSSQSATYSVTPDGSPDTIQSSEYHSFKINAYPNVGSVLESQFTLKFNGKISDIETLKGNSIKDVVKEFKDYEQKSLLIDLEDKTETNEKFNVSFKDTIRLRNLMTFQ